MNAHVAEPLAAAVRTTCPYCGVGCGVIARPDGLAGPAIEGDPEHPSSFGRLCSKGAALGETLGLDGRLLHPMIEGRRASWDAALAVASEGFTRIAAEHGPDAVAFYLSGQLLTEDYYVANKLMKGFIGRRPPARFRRRHGAGLLRGPRSGRPRRPRRLERGLVPPDPLPPHARRARAARREDRRH